MKNLGNGELESLQSGGRGNRYRTWRHICRGAPSSDETQCSSFDMLQAGDEDEDEEFMGMRGGLAY